MSEQDNRKESLFSENQGLVGMVFWKEFSRYIQHKEDLFQEGFLSLWKACLSFDPELGYKFSTYAVPCIRRSLQNYVNHVILKHANSVSLEESLSEDETISLIDVIRSTEEDITARLIIQKAISSLGNKSGIIQKITEGYTQDQVADMLGVSQTQVHRVLKRFRSILKEEFTNA